MPNINLIAARRDEKRKLERLTRQLFFTSALSVGVLVLVGSYLGTRRVMLIGNLQTAEERMKKVQPTLDEIDRIQKETTDRQPKVATLESARKTTLRWCALFQAVAHSMPANTWITRLESTEGDPAMVTLTGVTGSQTAAGETVMLLQQQPLFQSVDIHFTQRNQAPNESVERVSFEIVAMMRPVNPPEAPPPAAAPGKQTAQTTAGTGGKGNG